MIKVVQVLSIFDLKGGTCSSASRDIDSTWRSIYGLFCRQKKRTGRHKNTECSYIVMILLSHVLGTKTHWFSTWHGMVAARIWLDIVYTGRWEGAEPSWFCASSFYQSELGQHGTARLGTAHCWHVLVMFTLPPLIMPNRAGTVLAWFQVPV